MEADPLATVAPERPSPTIWDSLAGPARSWVAVKAAYVMSWVVAALMIVATVASVLDQHLYLDGRWAREALRGGDVVTLIVVVPMLILSLILVTLGSRRAVVVWMGVLAYTVYNYAFAVFGAAFNDVFLLHISLLSLSVYALACALPNLYAAGLARPLRGATGARWVGLFLVIVGVAQGMLWVFVVSRNALTGEVMHDVPVAGQHLVFALDLALCMPALVVGGLLLFRRTSFGFVLGPAMVLMGALYQLNLLVAGAYQAGAHVAGVRAFPFEGVVLTALFVAATLFVLLPRPNARRRSGDEEPHHRTIRPHLSLIHSAGPKR